MASLIRHNYTAGSANNPPVPTSFIKDRRTANKSAPPVRGQSFAIQFFNTLMPVGQPSLRPRGAREGEAERQEEEEFAQAGLSLG